MIPRRTNTSMSRANQDRLVLEGEMRALREKLAALPKTMAPGMGSGAASSSQAQIDPALAAPLYVRDKVAKTISERLGEGGRA